MQSKLVANRCLIMLCAVFVAASAGAADSRATQTNTDAAVQVGADQFDRINQKSTERRIAIQPTTKITTALPATSETSEDSKTSGGGVFKPSEDISEDFAVPFPVDI